MRVIAVIVMIGQINTHTASETTDTKREVVNSGRTGWIYWHWMYSRAYDGTTGQAISPKKGNYMQVASSMVLVGMVTTTSMQCSLLLIVRCLIRYTTAAIPT